MKIGIITFQYANNYGALLQAYALRKYLLDLGNEVRIINYDNSKLYMKNRSLRKKIITKVWMAISFFLGRNKKYKKFEMFRNNYLMLEKNKITNKNHLYQYIADLNFDVYIVGSDQVWNPYITMNDDIYYLSFSDSKKKIAYAASFGVDDFPYEYKNIFLKCINKFNFISVREKTGKNILNKMGITDISIVLDPVFLLGKNQWSDFAEIKEYEPYIFCYYMPGDKKCEENIKEIALKLKNKFGYKIINIGRKEYKKFLNDGIDIVSASPNEFLGYFKNASFIITNSFHGTAFSLIFEKNFYSVVNLSNSGKGKLSSRIVDLLESIGLKNNIIDNDSENIDNIFIDYDEIKFKINMLKEQSKNFLETALG